MVHKLLTWCGGYVMVRLPAVDAGRFINLSGSHKIAWWGVTLQKKQGNVYGYMKRKDYYRLRPIVRKTGTFPLVVKRIGGYFWWRRIVKRASFWWGIACFCVLLYLLSGRIWGIQIQGQSYHTKESILAYLDTIDIYGGMAGKSVVCADVETLLRQQYEDVGWVSVEKSGSVLYVRMDEVVLQEQQKETTGNLVARDTGRVVSIVTRQGTAKVRAGDKVKKGNILISGKVKVVGDDDEVVEKKKVQAQGSVVVCSSRQYQKSIQKNVLKWEYTGRNRALYQWQIGKNNLFICNPLKNLETYEKYDIIREGGCVCPFLSLRFPVSLWKKTFREVTWQNVTYSKQEAESLLGEEYTYYLEQMKEDGCFDVTGELNVLEQADSFVGTAKITYSRQQSGDVSDS